jgi:hypothetical protein
VPRRRSAAPGVPDDEAVTDPIRRDALDRAAGTAWGGPESVDPPLRLVTARRPASSPSGRGTAGPSRPIPTHSGAARRGVPPWETPPVDRPSTRAGLVAVAIGAIGALLGLAPWSGLLPRVLPASATGATPVFNLAGALLGVVALGLGAVAMFRATGTTRGLLAGVIGACVGAAAIVVGLVV